jgi:hypothetical protein
VLPYMDGSRVPRRLRLGPLMRRIDLDIVLHSMLKLDCGGGTAGGFDGIRYSHVFLHLPTWDTTSHITRCLD